MGLAKRLSKWLLPVLLFIPGVMFVNVELPYWRLAFAEGQIEDCKRFISLADQFLQVVPHPGLVEKNPEFHRLARMHQQCFEDAKKYLANHANPSHAEGVRGEMLTMTLIYLDDNQFLEWVDLVAQYVSIGMLPQGYFRAMFDPFGGRLCSPAHRPELRQALRASLVANKGNLSLSETQQILDSLKRKCGASVRLRQWVDG
jgi:hypothetical protein